MEIVGRDPENLLTLRRLWWTGSELVDISTHARPIFANSVAPLATLLTPRSDIAPGIRENPERNRTL